MANNAKNNVSITTTVTKDEDFKIKLLQVDAEREIKRQTGVNMKVTRGSIIRDLVRKGLSLTRQN
jgi:hypothetical protein